MQSVKHFILTGEMKFSCCDLPYFGKNISRGKVYSGKE